MCVALVFTVFGLRTKFIAQRYGGSVFVIPIVESRDMIGATEHWHTVARWLQSWNI